MSIRLSKAIKECNVGLQTAVDFLNKKGIGEVEANLNTKISDEQYELLLKEFKPDSVLKDAANHMLQQQKEEKERKGTITLKNADYNLVAELYITQKAFVPAITIEPESLTFAVEGGTQEIAITANFEYAYSANADWLTIETSEKGLNISATPNTKFEECTAEITISSEKYGISKAITITQQGVSAETQNVILYTSSDGKIATPYKSDSFGANIVSNTYRDGQGIIIVDAPITSIGDYAFYNAVA